MNILAHLLLTTLLSTTALASPSSNNTTTHYPALTSPLGPVINLGYAAYAGNTTTPTGEANGTVAFFGGIPYAQPPVGELRFRAPQPLDETPASDGKPQVVDARNFGPACLQQPAVVGVGSEDCLLLNVWKPSNASEGDNLPVVGGGFYAGTTQGFPLYPWVTQDQQIVGVSMGYRLSVPGFLATPSLLASGDGNAGLRDQRAALDWVQRNIRSFGGDPQNVAIAGESAGGASVVMQIAAYGGQREVPFRRGTGQSIGFGPMMNDTQNAELFANITQWAGCPSSPESTALACLRTASLGALVSAINHTPLGAVSPTVDAAAGADAFLPDRPSRLIAQGKFASVGFTGGHCSNDGRTFVGGAPEDLQTEEEVASVPFKRWPGVTNETIQEALALYPPPSNASGAEFSSEYDRASIMAGDVIFTCMDWFLAEQMMRKGVQDVYAFQWNAPDPVLLKAAPYEGTMHTSDIYFLFEGTSADNAGFTFTPFNSTELALSQTAIAYWTSFASTGSPSTLRLPGSPEWLAFAPGYGRMVLTEATTATANATGAGTASAWEAFGDAHVERCLFWMREDVTAQTAV
ncbi:alpha beta-hydrolase [Coniophora puteana RWD-64-598 SS2]|uniref:Carboxylic ester hydrolase n=1 Tax=Coniophora puteana (strain RWD-64-598) TaxID=741705 RepID=A0A5M3MED5_CONPW|nr:alpha beta-hydrolase [Coniophora puteana RWD-64-598 SS2]EIW77366.1 alpha beta-hydrolase [Coniophora puteana RWD-64-598 SS2]